MKKLSLLLVSTLLASVFAFFPVAVGAQNDNSDGTQPPSRDVLSAVDSYPTDRCHVVEERLKNTINRVEEAVKKKKERYADIVQKVERIITVGEEYGVEVADLKRALGVFNQKVEVFANEARELLAILNETKDLACGDDREAFREALAKSRVQLRVTKAAAKDVRAFLSEALIPEARDVLRQLKELQG